jgi:preprotein translocase subunit SecG
VFITLLTIFHLLVCALLVFVVLIQSSKGSELGAAFGGSNQTLFGSRGAATFLNKLTTGAAIAFMLTSLALAVFHGGSVMSGAKPVKESPAKSSPEATTGPVQEPASSQQEPVKEAPVQPAGTGQ